MAYTKDIPEHRRKIKFDIHGRGVRGYFIDVDSKLILVEVISDDDDFYKEGDKTHFHKKYLNDLEDQKFIDAREYDNLSITQKIFGKYYLGIPLVIGVFWYIFS